MVSEVITIHPTDCGSDSDRIAIIKLNQFHYHNGAYPTTADYTINAECLYPEYLFSKFTEFWNHDAIPCAIASFQVSEAEKQSLLSCIQALRATCDSETLDIVVLDASSSEMSQLSTCTKCRTDELSKQLSNIRARVL